MPEKIKEIVKNSKIILSIIVFVFAAGGWATKIYLVVEQTRIDQVRGDEAIVRSIDKQTSAIGFLTKTLADHEARLRVNEIQIRDLRAKANQ